VDNARAAFVGRVRPGDIPESFEAPKKHDSWPACSCRRIRRARPGEHHPAGTSFVRGTVLGTENDGTLWIGFSRAFAQVGGTGGSLYRLKLS
jgi:hypothetical protein